MNKEKNLVPRLRFPEFVNEGEWKQCTIDSIGSVITGSTPSKEENEFWNGNFVWITAQDFKDKYIFDSVQKLTQQGKDKSRIIPENSVLVTCIASIGLNAINKVECATNQQINAIVCNSNNHYEFVYYAISQNNNRLKNLAGQTAVPIINKSVFEKFTVQIPQPAEQQKIASCLSSLDELIAAHTDKLEALKDHKKGVMQQLFPAEEETEPKLRFKEFEKDGEWVETTLGDNCTLITKGTTPKQFSDVGIRFIKIEAFEENNILPEKCTYITENTHLKELKRSILKENDILFAIAGATIGKVNKVNKSLLPANTNQALAIIRLNEKVCVDFILYILKSHIIQDYISKNISVGAQPNINLEQMNSFSFQMPYHICEQQKIANFLTSIDDEIAAQTQKIEGLKEHKKGLMQGLFPSV